MTRKQRRNRSSKAPASQPQGWSRDLASQAATTAAAVVVIVGGAGAALALPEGMVVRGGQLQLSQPDPNSLVITQGTTRAAADFSSFNIGASERVQIRQPDASSALLGRITNGNITEIHGRLDANGRVVLVNPAGILVGPTGVINTAAFTATTLQADPTAFLHNGLLTLKDSGSAESGAAVINQGTIGVVDGGYAALLAPNVVNQGQIRAKLGSVQLASGTAASLDVSGDGLLSVALSPGVAGSITHGGTIAASHVRISAGDAAALVSGTVDLGGLIEASSADQLLGAKPASIAITSAGHVNLTGKLDVSTSTPGASGGVITVQAPHIRVKAGAQLDARGDGGGGQILVGGSWQNSQPSLGQALTTTVESGAVLDASATNRGKGGTVVAWSDLGHPTGVTSVAGTLRAEGGINGGDGGRIETSGHLLRVDGIKVSTQAPFGRNGLWLLDPTDVEIVTGAAGGSTGGSLNTALVDPGSSTITTTDLQNAINGGNDVTVQASGSITQSGALDFIVGGTDKTPTLTLDTTLGSKGAITLADITDSTTTTGSGVNLIAKSEGGAITAGGAISVKGGITLDNTIGVTTTTGASGITVNEKLTATGDITLRGVSTTAEGVRVNTATLISDGGSIGLYGSTLSETATGHAVFVGNVSDFISAKGNIEIAGHNTSKSLFPKSSGSSGLPNTGYVGTSLGGAFLAGGDITLAGYGYAGGVRLGNAGETSGSIHAAGDLRIGGSALTNNVATVDANKPATAFADGIGVDINMRDTTYTTTVGPNIGTYEGIISRKNAIVYGSAEQNNSDNAFGQGVNIGGRIGTAYDQTLEAMSWTITAINGGDEGSQPAFAAYKGSLTSTSGGITINADSLNSRSQPSGVDIWIPIVSANGIAINSTVSSAKNVITLRADGSLTNNAGDITIIGNNNSGSAVNGITLEGAINQNANGGTISLISNSRIVQSGTITLAKNTTADSTLLFDTTSGDKNASITAGPVNAGMDSSKLIHYRALARGAAIKLNNALDMPGSITLDNTYGCSGSGCTPTSGFITSDNAWSLATTSTAGGIQISQSLAAQTGLSIRGAVGASSDTAKQAGDAVSILNSDTTKALILSSAGSFSAGQDAISITGITPQYKVAAPTRTGTNKGNAIQIAGSGTVAINNKSNGGNTTITANTGRLSFGDTVSISNNAAVSSGPDPTGSIVVNAIGENADIQTLAGSSITQKSNAGIYLATSKNGNITPAKIVNSGTGNVVIAAGATLAVGTGTGGQITGLDGNTLSSDLGNVYLYSGAPTSSASSTTETSVTQLEYLFPSLASLSFSNTVFGQAYHTGNVPAPGLPDAAINTANVPSGNTSTGLGGTPVIQFRIQPTYNMVLNSNLTKVYGSSDPSNTTNSVTTPGSLEYALAQNFSTAATNPTGVRTNGSTTEIILNVNGVEFYKPLNEFLNTVTGTRPGSTTMAGQQVYSMPTSGIADPNYTYSLSTSIPGIQLSSGVLTDGSVGSTPVGLSITPKPLTIYTNASNFTYDASTAFSNKFTPSGLITTVDGLTTGDAVSSATTTIRSGPTLGQGNAVSAPFSAPANAGSYNSVLSDAVGTGLSNYAITYGGTAFSVAQAPLTVSDLTALNRPYNATTAAQLVGTPTLVGALIGAPVSISSGGASSGTFASPNAGVAIGVTPDLSTLVLSNPNYKLVGPTNPLFATISPASLTISGLNAADITYNGSALATISGTASLAGAIANAPSVSLVGGPVTSGLFASADAAPSVTVSPNLGGLSLAGPGAANYVISGPTAPLQATINPKPLSVAVTGQSKVYDATANALLSPGSLASSGSYSLSGFVAGQGGYISQTVGSYNSAHVATATTVTTSLSSKDFVALSGTNLGNYVLPSQASGPGTITPAPLTLTALPTSTFIGVAPDLSGSLQVSGLKGTDTLATVLPNASVSPQGYATASSGAGAYDLLPVAGANGSSDYAVVTPLVSPGALTVVGNYQLLIDVGNSSTVFGSTTADDVTSGVVSKNASGVIARYCTTCSLTNSSPNLVDLSVSAPATAGSPWQAMDSQFNTSYTFNITPGVTAGDYSSGSTPYLRVGTYGLTPSGMTLASGTSQLDPSLPVIYTPGSLSVTPLVLNFGIQPSGLGRTYNGSTALEGLALTASNLPTGIAPLTVAAYGQLDSPNANPTASYSITSALLSGVDSANFLFPTTDLSSAQLGTVAITPAPLTISGNQLTSTYSGTTKTNSWSVQGLIGNDRVNSVSGSASGTNAGIYTDALSNASGSGLSNYDITYNNGSYLINRAVLDVVANNNGKIVTQADPSLTATVGGLQGQDTLASIGLNYTLTRTAGEGPGSYAISINGPTTTTNYSVNYGSGQFTLAPAGVALIKMKPLSSLYGSTAIPLVESVEYGVAAGSGVTIKTLTAGSTPGEWIDGIGGSIQVNPHLKPGYDNTTPVGAYTNVVTNTNSGLSLSAGNFSSVDTVENVFRVGATPLFVTGQNTSKTFNNQTQTNGNATVVGLIGQDSISLSGLGSGLHVGNFTDQLLYSAGANTNLDNYQIIVTNGSLTITPALLNALITPVDKVYDGTTSLVGTVNFSGILPDTFVSGKADLALAAPGAGPQTIINNGISLSGVNAGDYAIASYLIADTTSKSISGSNNGLYGSNNGSGSGVSIAVQRAPVTIAGASTSQTFTNQNKVNANPLITGLVGQESLTMTGLASGLHAGTYTDKLVYSGGANTNLDNYAITVTNGSLTITPALLNALITPVDKVYNGSTSLASTVSLSGILPDTSVAGKADLTLAAPGAGPQTIINNGISLSGVNAGDYTIASYLITDTTSKSISGSNNGLYGSNNGSGSGVSIAVQRAPVTIAGASTSQTFTNQNKVNANPLITGLVGQESLTMTGLASGLHAGTYTDKLVYSGGANTNLDNYAINVTNGSLTITPAPLSATITPADAYYNGSTSLANTVSLSGVYAGTSVFGKADLSLSAAGLGTRTIINNGVSLYGANAGDYTLSSFVITNNATQSISGEDNGIIGFNNGIGSGLTISVKLATSFKDDVGIRQLFDSIDPGLVQNQQLASYFPGASHRPGAATDDNGKDTGRSVRLGPLKPSFRIETDRAARFNMGLGRLLVDPGTNICLIPAGCGLSSLGLSKTTSYLQQQQPQNNTSEFRIIGTDKKAILRARPMVSEASSRPAGPQASIQSSKVSLTSNRLQRLVHWLVSSR